MTSERTVAILALSEELSDCEASDAASASLAWQLAGGLTFKKIVERLLVMNERTPPDRTIV